MLTSSELVVPVASVDADTSTFAPKKPAWEKRLADILWINSVAISNDGARIVAATFLHDYRQGSSKFIPTMLGRFGVYCFDGIPQKDAFGQPTARWADEYDGWGGIYGVAISGDGAIAAAGGWLEKNGSAVRGVLRAYNAADGKKILDYTDFTQRMSWVALSNDGTVLAAVADDVYVFIREGKAFNPIPLRLGIGGLANRYVTNVAVHPDGNWLAACDQAGHVYMATIANGRLSRPFTWTAPENVDIPFLSVAIAANSNTFVAGGGNFLFHFSVDGMRQGAAPTVFDTTVNQDPKTVPPEKSPGKLQENVRWVAISDDGQLFTTVVNRLNGDKSTGLLVAFAPNTRQPLWTQPLDSSPNSTSIDSAGLFVTASDGYPTGNPAKFYLFDGKNRGARLWEYTTCNMNWPMVISANASAIAAGSDDGSLYYFTP